MKKNTYKKTLSYIVSTVLTFSLLVSANPAVLYADEIPPIVYSRYDEQKIDTLLDEFSDACFISNNDAVVTQLYNEIISEYDMIVTQKVIANIYFDTDPSNEEYSDEVLYMADIINNVSPKIDETLSLMINISEYSDLLHSLTGDLYEYLAYYEATDTPETNTQQEIYNEYSKLMASDISDDEKELKAAQLYLDLVNYLNSISSTGNYLDDAYIAYGRDYTTTDMDALSDSIKKSTKKIFNFALDKASGFSYSASCPQVDNPFLEVDKYAGLISDELKESSQFILNNNLYRLADVSESSGVSYTTSLPSYKTAYIFQTVNKSFSDITTAIHEFGHFNNMRHNDTPAYYIYGDDLDLSEVQSQGLEMLYTQFYDDIDKENAQILRIINILDFTSAISGGFMVNEFENTIFSDADRLTPQDVIDVNNSIMSEYGNVYDVDFYQIPHLYMSPGYYISYAVSALAALDLLKTCNDGNFDKAVQMYTDISHCSTYNPQISFADSLSQCGFDNVLSDKYISDLVVSLNDYTSIQSGIIPGDVNSNGTVSAADLICIKDVILGSGKFIDSDGYISENKLHSADINYDDSVDALDIAAMVCKLLR
ncbi:MAG: dockerin type I domain-containing protein [Oscillospiraceae bacterium]|nr:dockerin type I domain-containing protein [Oscillospiraceae bacterium]